MNEIAVTGANGMTGSHMVSLLKSEGIPVKEVTRQEWDLTEWKSFDDLDHIFGSVLAVFHFGAQLPCNDSKNDNWQTQQIFDANIRSCLNLSEWAKLRNVPIVFLSGAVVYKNPHASMIIETDPKVVNGFGGFYGYSKLLSEGIFGHLSAEGLECIILRPSSIYGYGLPSEKLVQNYVNMASSNRDIRITGYKNRINLIHAYDVANAALSAYKSKAWGTFNISSRAGNTILEIAETAVSISGSRSIVILDDDKNTLPFTRFDLDSKLAKKSFGFKTEINLKKGMLLMKNKMFIPC
jgi:nucleoside-diphosphate-sugar epimerase